MKIQAHNIRSVMFVVPCRTFSVAAGRGGRPIRTHSAPRGTAGSHTAKEVERIEEGNRILDAMVKILRSLRSANIPFIIENPQSSTLWHDSAFASAAAGTTVDISQCAFGSRARKTTRLLYNTVGER